jgi:hypothetical protein
LVIYEHFNTKIWGRKLHQNNNLNELNIQN